MAFLAFWEVLGWIPGLPHYLLPPFSQVVWELIELLFRGGLATPLGWTIIHFLSGLVLGLFWGLLLGFLAGVNEGFQQSLRPLISFLYPIPSIGWIPIFMLWLGVSEILPIAVSFVSAFFPIYLNSLRGVREINRNIIQAARLMDASRKAMIFRVILPLALPNILTGLELESGAALRTVLVAEMVAIPSGLGYLLMKGQSLIDAKLIFAVLLLIALISLSFSGLVKLLERRLLRWKD